MTKGQYKRLIKQPKTAEEAIQVIKNIKQSMTEEAYLELLCEMEWNTMLNRGYHFSYSEEMEELMYAADDIPDEGYIPDSKTAIKVAEAIYLSLYGEIRQPFQAEYEKGTDTWCIRGEVSANLCSSLLFMTMRKSTGEVLYLNDLQDAEMTRMESEEGQRGNMPAEGIVLDEATAIKIAEAIWLPLYGTGIYQVQPFKAKYEEYGKDWNVWGTLPYDWLGGVPELKISKRTGEILFHRHLS